MKNYIITKIIKIIIIISLSIGILSYIFNYKGGAKTATSNYYKVMKSR